MIAFRVVVGLWTRRGLGEQVGHKGSQFSTATSLRALGQVTAPVRACFLVRVRGCKEQQDAWHNHHDGPSALSLMLLCSPKSSLLASLPPQCRPPIRGDGSCDLSRRLPPPELRCWAGRHPGGACGARRRRQDGGASLWPRCFTSGAFERGQCRGTVSQLSRQKILGSTDAYKPGRPSPGALGHPRNGCFQLRAPERSRPRSRAEPARAEGQSSWRWSPARVAGLRLSFPASWTRKACEVTCRGTSQGSVGV